MTRAGEKPLFIDGLSFLPNEPSDVRASGLNAYIADISAIEVLKRPDGSMNYKRTYKACMKSIREARGIIELNPAVYRLALNGGDIEKARNRSQCAIFFQIQGADCVEENLSQVDEFYDLGLRVMQMTHHYGNIFAGGAQDVRQSGLTERGRVLVEKLQAKNMMVDISHSSDVTARDILALTKRPIVQTHGAARAIVNNARCTPDNILRSIGQSGGVFGVFMMSFWLTNDDVPTADHYVAQLKHVANVAGIEAVAIANDFPLRGQQNLLNTDNDNKGGVKQYLEWWQDQGRKGILGFDRTPSHVVIPEFNDIDRMARIYHHLGKAGFKADHVDKIMGENWKRVLTRLL